MRPIQLANFEMLFNSEYVDNLEHPKYAELKAKGVAYIPQKLSIKLKPDAVEQYYPFATVFSNRGWAGYREALEKDMPEGFKIIFESKKAVNSTHMSAGQCQYIVVVDKNES